MGVTTIRHRSFEMRWPILARTSALSLLVLSCSEKPAPMQLAAAKSAIEWTETKLFRDCLVELPEVGAGMLGGKPFEFHDVGRIQQLVDGVIGRNGDAAPTGEPTREPPPPRFIVRIARETPLGRAAPLLDVLRRSFDADEGRSLGLLQLEADAHGKPRVFPVALRSSFGGANTNPTERDVTVYVACVHAMPTSFALERPWSLLRTPPEAGLEESSSGRAMALDFAFELLERAPPVRNAALVTRVLDSTPWSDVIALLETTLPAAPSELQFDLAP